MTIGMTMGAFDSQSNGLAVLRGRAARRHVRDLHRGRQQVGHVGAHAGHHNGVSVPMGGVQVGRAMPGRVTTMVGGLTYRGRPAEGAEQQARQARCQGVARNSTQSRPPTRMAPGS